MATHKLIDNLFYLSIVQRLVAKETDMPRQLDADALQRELEEVRVMLCCDVITIVSLTSLSEQCSIF